MKHWLLSIMLVSHWCAVSAQTPAEANTAFANSDWPATAKAYAALVEKDPSNPLYWARLGFANHKQQQLDEAMRCYQRALQNTPPPALQSVTLYRMGWVWAQRGQHDSALVWFSRAVPLGFQNPGAIDNEPTLAAFKQSPQYGKLLQHMQRQKEPCKFDEKYRQFDFWVGEWDVVNSQNGNPAGSSSIQKLIGDCVIYENWTSASNPYTGKSFNVYDAQTQTWQQYWVDDKGGVLFFFNGKASSNSLQYEGQLTQPNGEKTKTRLTFTQLEPDKVRQHYEIWDGKTQNWTTNYMFTYNRKKGQ